MNIRNVFDFNKALATGEYAWPGGYPQYFVTADGGALCWRAAVENAGLIRDAVIGANKRGGWCVVGLVVNLEDTELTCDHTNERIPCAYPPDDDDTEHCDACGAALEASQIGKCDDCQDSPMWCAGWNMPGYMPDSEPAMFDTRDEAKRYIIAELKRAEEDTESEDEAETLCHFAEEVNLQSGEFSGQCGKWVYWVTK